MTKRCRYRKRNYGLMRSILSWKPWKRKWCLWGWIRLFEEHAHCGHDMEIQKKKICPMDQRYSRQNSAPVDVKIKRGVNSFKLNAPAIKHNVLKMILAMACWEGWKLHHIDISNAYLNSDIECTVYMKSLEGSLEEKSGHLYQLKKSVYGLKTTAKTWCNTLSMALKKIGMLRTKIDPCVFISEHHSQSSAVLVVDDLLITESDEKGIKIIINQLSDMSRYKVPKLVHLWLFCQKSLCKISVKTNFCPNPVKTNFCPNLVQSNFCTNPVGPNFCPNLVKTNFCTFLSIKNWKKNYFFIL